LKQQPKPRAIKRWKPFLRVRQVDPNDSEYNRVYRSLAIDRLPLNGCRSICPSESFFMRHGRPFLTVPFAWGLRLLAGYGPLRTETRNKRIVILIILLTDSI
jgi:hypothetical protein